MCISNINHQILIHQYYHKHRHFSVISNKIEDKLRPKMIKQAKNRSDASKYEEHYNMRGFREKSTSAV